MMTITLYDLAGENSETRFSPHCWKTRLALLHKGLPMRTVPVRFTEKDKIEFSGQPLVPVLMDAGKTIVDSWEIACYLEKAYPDTPSLFNDEAGKALAQSINEWASNDLSKYVRPLVVMDVYNLIGDEDKQYFRQSREAKLGKTLEEFCSDQAGAIQGLRAELEKVRELLAMQPYLGGQDPSYADISLLGTLLWIASVNDIEFLDLQDVVYDWYQRMLDAYPDAKAAAAA